jgi:two-component system, NtrC family, response regulator GlrR
MGPVSILVLDLDPPSDSVGALARELLAMTDPSVTVHYECATGSEPPAAISNVAAAMRRIVPRLVVVVLSGADRRCATGVFDLVLGQKHSPPIVGVPPVEEADLLGELFRWGASDCLVPPFRASEVQPRVRRLLREERGPGTPVSLLKESLGLKQLVGESPALVEQIRKIPRMAASEACILVTGETGTGKELCARAIHYLSPRGTGPFVPLNCGAIPVDLVENELFGHEAGAYTGANTAHAGVIREADGGTLFLDEIDSLPLPAQVKLLRFLQEREYRPLGASRFRQANVRVIAALNGDPAQLLADGRLRRDLFYRLNVLPVCLPPLRQRKEDIPLLAGHFLAKHAARSPGLARDIAPAALRKLALYDWPGNVRELENVIERAVVLSADGVIQSREIDLPLAAEPGPEVESFNQLKARLISDFEQDFLRTLLTRYHGNIAQAARAAQKNRRAFFQLMRKHHIRVERPNAGVAANPVVSSMRGMDKPVHPIGLP